MTRLPTQTVELLVVGAGPVGLFGALCAARRGLEVMVLDQSWQGFGRGYATILHPRSLRLLREVGLTDELFSAGRRIDRVAVYVDRTRVALLDLPSPGLAIAQSTLEEVLLTALRAEGVKPHAPQQATTIEQNDDGVNVQVMRRELVRLGSPADYSEWQPVESSVVRAKFVLGADGYDSRVRAALGISTVTVGSTESFAIFEFPTASQSDEVELCFEGSLGSAMTPLPSGRARWVFQVVSDLDRLPDSERLRTLLSERAPWYQDGAKEIDWGNVIQFERRLARRFGEGRVWLAGDAAHVTSPFGGQSVNGGLLEAHDLAHRIADCVSGEIRLDALEHYGRERQREWHKLLGVNVSFDLLPHAPAWLASNARRLVPAFPASGRELEQPLERLGLKVH
jgi:2-polyprenyl-6-methoxyphenol hydroxylase-like FAD-dependent oxidoreductase